MLTISISALQLSVKVYPLQNNPKMQRYMGQTLFWSSWGREQFAFHRLCYWELDPCH